MCGVSVCVRERGVCVCTVGLSLTKHTFSHVIAGHRKICTMTLTTKSC